MEYPNAKITANIAPHTQYGRLIIPDQILPNENPDNNPKFMRAGKFIEDLETGDFTKIGHWMKLPTSYSLIKKFEKWKDKRYETKDGYVVIKSRHPKVVEEKPGEDLNSTAMKLLNQSIGGGNNDK